MAVNTVETQAPAEEKAKLMITPSPHFRDDINTRKIMLTVATALLPALVMSIFYFGIRALLLTAVCVVSCVVFEYLFAKVTKKPVTISDCSAVVTGIILAFNVPVTLPFWMAVIRVVHRDRRGQMPLRRHRLQLRQPRRDRAHLPARVVRQPDDPLDRPARRDRRGRDRDRSS